ncbi:MAG: hypothetical protein Q9160_006381 [Pyrenula sp. 1 TL-2023]
MLAIPMTPPAPHVQTSTLKTTTSCASEVSPVPSPAFTQSLSSQANATLLTSPTTPSGASSRRPKLSLQTASLPLTFGKSSTNLIFKNSLSAHPAASPTIRNTFSNAYDIPHRPSPASASPMNNHNKFHASRRLMSPFPKKDDEPYTLPIGPKSILKNTPHPRSSHARSNSISYRRPSISCLSSTNSPSPKERRRVFFPTAKKVNYRLPLAEDIKTVRFTLCHSDIPSSDNSNSENDSDSEASDAGSVSSDSESDIRGLSSPQKRKRQDSQREDTPRKIRLSPSPPDRAPVTKPEDHQLSSRTPGVSKRRRREWKWTLGTIAHAESTSPSSQVSDSAPTSTSSDSSTPVSSSTISSITSPLSLSRPKLGLNTSLAQSTSSASSYANSSELPVPAADVGGSDEVMEKRMPGEKTPFPRSREGSVESADENDQALIESQLQASLEDRC